MYFLGCPLDQGLAHYWLYRASLRQEQVGSFFGKAPLTFFIGLYIEEGPIYYTPSDTSVEVFMTAQPWVHHLSQPAPASPETCCITPLPLEDAAKLSALAELFPQQSQEEIISTLLSQALSELERLETKNR